ncbi:glycoside hydrolase family 3 N-terminal domain-containing protein [Streptomyces scabiei]|uniref:glycoside hydrolase family 3 N-terminal domain-containing protein n=1 Tax=Streptomyces scabiei TaxID=1930 RepID=UPI001FF2E140|nr:glycoside hydrolase family 3 N-terminal domain-containing protein [Streptomyces sp. LBUM 1481]
MTTTPDTIPNDAGTRRTQGEARYRDAGLPVEDRVADLLAQMTLEEKAGQLTQFFYMGTGEPIPDDFDIESLPPEHRAFVQQPHDVEDTVSRGGAGSLLFVKDPALGNRLQRRAVEDTRLGIPLLFGNDVIHGCVRSFPCRSRWPRAGTRTPPRRRRSSRPARRARRGSAGRSHP